MTYDVNWPEVYREICNQSSEALMITGADLRILYVNQAFEVATGYSASEVDGRKPNMLSSGYQDNDFYQRMWQSIDSEGRWQGLIWNRRKDGSVYPEWLTIFRLQDGSATYYAGQFSDLSALDDLRNDLRHFACYDHLTHLPNRALFEDLVAARLHQDSRRSSGCALLFVDIDHFKEFNDVHGHSYGDTVIQAAAQRLKNELREGDIVARFGGDEFVVLLDECDNADCLQDIAKRMVRAFEVPLSIADESRYLSISVGAARSPDDGADAETLIRNADIALYSAKEKGRGRACCFSHALFGPLQRANQVADALRVELDRQPRNFSVAYQPQYDLDRDQLVGLEALLRWNSSLLGTVSPAEFIPIAEHHGLIHKLTERLVAQVSEDIDRVYPQDLRNLTLCLNVSALQMPQPTILPLFKPLLSRSRDLGLNLELEITETQLVLQDERFPKALSQLQAAGFGIAIDDFGVGYSALGYLQRLPVNTLKIDRSFVTDCHRSPQSDAIVRAVIAMGHGLGLKVIAEGIEHEEQLLHLRQRHCQMGQGYLLGKPQPLNGALTGLRPPRLSDKAPTPGYQDGK